MSLLVVLRHAPTSWNRDRRLQGRTDVALDEEAIAIAARWRAPLEWAGHLLLVSPLARARVTASILFPESPQKIEPRLIEMNYGEWEGQRLSDLRGQRGAEIEERERLGLDFRAPGGESPREVQLRLLPLLNELALFGRPAVAVTHKAVIRALYSLATGWTMQNKPMHRLKDQCAHQFDLGARGMPTIVQLNHSLLESE